MPVQAPKVEVDSTFNPFKNPSRSQQNWGALYEGLDDFSDPPSPNSLFENESLHHQAPTFQFQKKYIVSTTKSGMLIVHQGRAHRRVLYECLLKQIDGRSVPAQILAFPIHIPLNQAALAWFLPHQKDLELMGFGFGKTNDDGVEVTAESL